MSRNEKMTYSAARDAVFRDVLQKQHSARMDDAFSIVAGEFHGSGRASEPAIFLLTRPRDTPILHRFASAVGLQRKSERNGSESNRLANYAARTRMPSVLCLAAPAAKAPREWAASRGSSQFAYRRPDPLSRASVAGHDRPAEAELEIEAGFHDVLGFANIDIGEHPARDGREGDRAGAEVVVVVLDESGEPVGERIFAADADRPTPAILARPDGHGGGRGDEPGVVVPFPGAAALDVAEEAVPGITDAAGDRGQRLRARVESGQADDRIEMSARRIRPIEVALDAKHPTANLPVAPGLDAADSVARVMAPEADPERSDRKRGNAVERRASRPQRVVLVQP